MSICCCASQTCCSLDMRSLLLCLSSCSKLFVVAEHDSDDKEFDLMHLKVCSVSSCLPFVVLLCGVP